MNNSGFNGTGTAFILYIVLAFAMPFVFMYRLLKGQKRYPRRFIASHFLLALLLSIIALVLEGYVWRLLLHTSDGRVHELILALTWVAVAALVAWVVIPQLIVMWYRVRGKTELLRVKSPLIHPWLELMTWRPVAKHRVIDGVAKNLPSRPRQLRLPKA